jgi:hypothetical protein
VKILKKFLGWLKKKSRKNLNSNETKELKFNKLSKMITATLRENEVLVDKTEDDIGIYSKTKITKDTIDLIYKDSLKTKDVLYILDISKIKQNQIFPRG